jgi:F0F1-type ATP synthase membrane subunit b/b'
MADENSRARTLLYDYTQQELENARGQLDSYSNTLKIEVANLIDGEVDKAKQDIALRIANKTNKAIEDIEKEFEKIIKDLNK